MQSRFSGRCVCVGVVEQEEKRKENEVFLDVFTAVSGVF